MITKEATATESAQAVRDVLEATTAAWGAGDADAFAELYAPDASVVLTGGVYLRGREEIRTATAALFAGPRKGTRSVEEPESLRVVGDAAVVVSRSSILLPGEDSAPAERQRRSTWTLARHDGWWLIEAYHNCAM